MIIIMLYSYSVSFHPVVILSSALIHKFIDKKTFIGYWIFVIILSCALLFRRILNKSVHGKNCFRNLLANMATNIIYFEKGVK